MDDDVTLAAAYWQWHRLTKGNRAQRLDAEANDSAWAAVADRMSDDPLAAVSLLDALLAADDADPWFVGAGPLEDLLVEHGPVVEDLVADRCRRSDKWRQAVAGVWVDNPERAALMALQPFLSPER